MPWQKLSGLTSSTPHDIVASFRHTVTLNRRFILDSLRLFADYTNKDEGH